MTPLPLLHKMTIPVDELPWPALQRARRTVVVVDMVESVRLMEANEEDTVRRWQQFVGEVATQVLPAQHGRLVKSLGDGLLCEFPDVGSAVQSALQMQQYAPRLNDGRSANDAMQMRIGAHTADVIVDHLDVYGSGVNLAARLMTLAGPGEIVVSTAVRDQLVPGLDAEVEDLGECYVKHLNEPLRAYRVGPVGRSPVISAGDRNTQRLVSTVAVIPFEGKAVVPPHDVMGELIADSVIARLSVCGAIRVISRLSTSVLQGRPQALQEASVRLGATFVVSGTYHVVGANVVLMAELADARDGEVLWADQLSAATADVLQPQSELVERIASSVMAVITTSEVRRVASKPLPSLHGYSLQLAGTALMHSSSLREFARAREVLEHLVDRHPREASPHAWMAKWYVLRVTRGLVEDLAAESARALEHTRRALEADPNSSLALAMEGFVHCHMLRDLDVADERLEQALRVNPNDSLAWLFKCVTQGFRGLGDEAIGSAERAIALSPLDPMRHYYDALAASAALAARQLAKTIELAQRSLKVNRNHLPTLRALAIAQVESDAIDEARRTVTRILTLEPGFTLREYMARSPRGSEVTRKRYGDALLRAGVPPA